MTREEILKAAQVKPDTFCPGCWHHVKKILRAVEDNSIITQDLGELEVRAAATKLTWFSCYAAGHLDISNKNGVQFSCGVLGKSGYDQMAEDDEEAMIEIIESLFEPYDVKCSSEYTFSIYPADSETVDDLKKLVTRKMNTIATYGGPVSDDGCAWRAPQVFEIWCEGHRATGESSEAHMMASVEAGSFREACDKHFGDNSLYDSERGTYWGCRLHDNEADARRAFG